MVDKDARSKIYRWLESQSGLSTEALEKELSIAIEKVDYRGASYKVTCTSKQNAGIEFIDWFDATGDAM
jgi:hypothetical protein